MIYIPGTGWFYRSGSYLVGVFQSFHQAAMTAWYDPVLKLRYLRRMKAIS